MSLPSQANSRGERGGRSGGASFAQDRRNDYLEPERQARLAQPSRARTFCRPFPSLFWTLCRRAPLLFRAPGREVKAKRLGVASYAQIQPWIDAEPALRKSNMARWKVLARNPEIRQALLANLAAHPEWEIVLRPPPAQSTNSTASDARPRVSTPIRLS